MSAVLSKQEAMSSEQPVKRKRGRPVQDANEGLRQALLDQSAKLFREKGYGNTTVRDIAAATGIHAGSWFYHFKTKHDILAAVVELGLTRAIDDIEVIGVDQLPPREALLRLIHQHLHTLLGPDQDYIPVMLYEWRSLDADAKLRIVGLQDRYEAIWDKVIARLHESGEWAMPTRLDRLLMFGALNWCAKWYKPDAGDDLAALAETALQFILRTPAGP
jgi:AcrR family transcriptional regulator